MSEKERHALKYDIDLGLCNKNKKKLFGDMMLCDLLINGKCICLIIQIFISLPLL